MPASQRDNKSEKPIETEFRLARKSLIKRVGSKALYGDVVDGIGKDLFGARWRGVHTQKNYPVKNGYQIINTDYDGPGAHWIALYITPRTIYVYDSYGRTSTNLLPLLVRRAGKRAVVDADYDPEQIGYTSQVCGVLCLAWLLMVSRYGVRKALLI
tara:strand:- start:3520 stop:3987 length:468 start_codon:yes stop_codon:yes gene_type:complete